MKRRDVFLAQSPTVGLVVCYWPLGWPPAIVASDWHAPGTGTEYGQAEPFGLTPARFPGSTFAGAESEDEE